ncbi:MAG: VPLPA-CTERM sorting domain-containing protein, partial [Candidatus Thiodiazotropha sp.]
VRSEGTGMVISSNMAGQGTLDVSGTSTLLLEGTQRTQCAINVANGASFDFNGNRLEVIDFTGDFVHDLGVYAPGASPAISSLTGDYTMLGSSILEVEIGGTNSGEFDQLFVTGDVVLDSGELLVSIIDDFTLSQGQTYDFLIADGSVTGTFLNYVEGSLIGNFGVDLFITYQAGDGNDIALYTSPVPLPAASWLLLTGVVGLFGFSRKSNKSQLN